MRISHPSAPSTTVCHGGRSLDIVLIDSLGVTFPLMKKSEVNGDNTNEVYKYLKNEKSGLLGLSRIKVPTYFFSTQTRTFAHICLSGTSRSS
jgi:hypothetical protein